MSFRKLAPSVKTKWLQALRSGRYSQGKSQLCEVKMLEYGKPAQNCYCCLGVLAEVKGKLSLERNINTVEYQPDTDESDKNDRFNKGQHERLSLNQKLRNTSTFVPSNWVDDKAQIKLAKMNDSGESFKKIASWISKNL